MTSSRVWDGCKRPQKPSFQWLVQLPSEMATLLPVS